MKKIIFGVIIGIIIGSGIVYAATYYAKDVVYEPAPDTSWEVDNVNDAINDLYEKLTIGTTSTSITYIGTTTGASWTGTTDYKSYLVFILRNRVGFSVSYSNCSASVVTIEAPSTQSTYAYGAAVLVTDITGNPTISVSGNGADQKYFVVYGIN